MGRLAAPLAHEKLVLCEGNEDAAMIRAFVDARGIQKDFDVRSVSDYEVGAGMSAFAATFSALELDRSFPRVERVLLVADNDDTPAQNFGALVGQIDAAKAFPGLQRNWGKPAQPLVIGKGSPAVLAWMWPQAGAPGCLETALLPGISAAFPKEMACVTSAAQCSGASAWSISKRDKAAVRCFFALACAANPGATLAKIWSNPKTRNFVPLDHTTLDPLEAFLRAF